MRLQTAVVLACAFVVSHRQISAAFPHNGFPHGFAARQHVLRVICDRNVAKRAVPLEHADGADLLAESPVLAELKSGPAELRAMMPESQDLPALATLLNDGFERFLAPYFVRGPFASPLNGFLMWSEEQFKRVRLEQRLANVLQKPSLRRPNDLSSSIGVMLMQRNLPDAPPVGYVEVLLLPPDGRRAGPTSEEAAEEEAALRAMVAETSETIATGLPTSGLLPSKVPAAEPYVQCLCIAPSMRRRGLGRKLMRLAESVIVQVWGKTRLYLHVDSDEAASNFAERLGYEVLGTPNLVHMCKQLDSVY